MSDDNYIEMNGVVETICRDKFTVLINDTEMSVICTVAGRMRNLNIRILVGDEVKVMVSAYDTTKGRIVYRTKVGQAS